MSSALIVRPSETVGRGRGPAFLPADLRPDPQGGLYQGLYKRLRGFILDGIWPPGTRLPSSRALAADLKVSRNTAILAVEQLVADGWAESRSRSGVYVSSAPTAAPALPLQAERVAPAELAPFALQRPATDLFPASIWKQLQTQAWAEIEPQRLLSADPAGDPDLREAIARLVCGPRGLRCHPDQIVVVPSATLALDLIAATLLRPGDAAAIEDPSRPALRQLLRARGAVVRPVQVDADGMAVALLAELPNQPKLVCVAPTAQFPTGTQLSIPRRAALLDWARGTGGWVIEDDRDSDAWFGDDLAPAPLAAEGGDRTVLIGSFNRLLFPGLCVAFLVAPPALAERLRLVQASIGGRASLASQLALRDFISEGHFARHLRRRRAAYAERRDLMQRLLGCDAINRAGLHLVLPTGNGRLAAATLTSAGLGGAALAAFSDTPMSDDPLLLGLGATPDQIESLAPALRDALATANQGAC